MKQTLLLLLITLLLVTGCDSAIAPTAIPVGTIGAPQPQAQATATVQLPPPSKCQSKLLGRVLDANGLPAKGAMIEARSGNFRAPTISDDSGLYGYAGLCAGTYTFTVTLPGQKAKPIADTIQL